jgi:hypothetical protein
VKWSDFFRAHFTLLHFKILRSKSHFTSLQIPMKWFIFTSLHFIFLKTGISSLHFKSAIKWFCKGHFTLKSKWSDFELWSAFGNSPAGSTRCRPSRPVLFGTSELRSGRKARLKRNFSKYCNSLARNTRDTLKIKRCLQFSCEFYLLSWFWASWDEFERTHWVLLSQFSAFLLLI